MQNRIPWFQSQKVKNQRREKKKETEIILAPGGKSII